MRRLVIMACPAACHVAVANSYGFRDSVIAAPIRPLSSQYICHSSFIPDQHSPTRCEPPICTLARSERAPAAQRRGLVYGRPSGTPAGSWRSIEEVDLVAVRFPHYLSAGHLGRSMWVTVFPVRRPWSRRSHLGRVRRLVRE